MSKIRIVNWLLTRRCNLNCDYCAIVKDYTIKPPGYPDISYYIKNEMTTDYIIKCLDLFKKHNPDHFNIFYGGEPLLRKDLPEIINFCNDNNIYYTIISNNTKQIQPAIKRLFRNTKYIQGFTSSVDPIFNNKNNFTDRVIKSIEGFKQLVEIKKQGKIKDVVAEITVMKHNVKYLFDLVKKLTTEGINSDITFIDISKNPFYDFSNIHDKSQLVTKEEAKDQIQMLLDSDLNIHMKDQLLPKIFDSLPSNMDCEIDKGLHNVTIDADGSIRLCLRVRGLKSPTIQAHQLFDKSDINLTSPIIQKVINKDKKDFCELCNHTCQLMSKIIDSQNLDPNDLVHKDIREGN